MFTHHRQNHAIANCLAQSEALMDGFSPQQAGGERHRVHQGDRPSNTLIFSELTPAILGQLIALYEHKVFVEGVVWGINPFDQWGVELGKKLATGLLPAIADPANYEGTNASTRALLDRVASEKDA